MLQSGVTLLPLLLLVCTTLSLTHSLTHSQQHYPINYQIHSNNDLNEWPQLLNKGAYRFKVDLHFLPSGVNCADKGYSGACFLLSHDTPDKHYISYNSSNDLIQFLSNNCSNNKENLMIVISLCFKSAPDKCNEDSEDFNMWLSMVDDLYDTLTSNPPQGIEFFLDGDAKPENCLVGRWPLWDSVWIQGSSPDEALYSNEGEYGRFQVLNDREGRLDWYKLAQEDYGKFTNSSSPYHLWEPDSQYDFHEYIKIYESGKIHDAGFCFAINIDIAMFNVYTTPIMTAPTSSMLTLEQASSANIQLVDDEAVSNPRIVSWWQNEANLSEVYLYVFQNNDLDTLLYSTIEVSRSVTTSRESMESSRSALPNSTWLLGSGSSVVVGVSSARTAGTESSLLLITSSSGRYCLYTANSADDALAMELCSVFSLSQMSGEVFDAILTRCDESGASDSMCAIVLSAGDANKIALSIIELPSAHVKGELVTDLSRSIKSLVFGDDPEVSKSPISSARLAEGDNGIFIFTSVDDRIVATIVENDRMSRAVSWTAIGVGKNIDVTVGAGGEMMLVTDFGFCYNSHKHNTRSTEKVCSSHAKPSEHVLDYTIGLEKDWSDLLLASTNASESFVTPCHGRLFHGSFDQGKHPSVALSGLTNAPPSFLELHEGLPQGTRSNGACGNPMHRGGLILDTFPIAEWMKNLES